MSYNKNEWSDKEKETLIKIFPSMGSEYCSNILGRTKRGCQEMAKRLKLKRIFKFQNEELVKDIVKNSKTYTECIIKIGLSPRCSGNFQTLKKYIKIYNIDISHFVGGNFKNGNIPKTKKELTEYLKKDTFVSTSTIKERLYKEGIKKRECEMCGQDENWKEKKISLILDHISGDKYDNRIENLQIVCPNCNATLSTHCVGTKVNKIYDKEKDEYKSDKVCKRCFCGKIILINSKMCTTCNGKKNRKQDRPDLNTLLKDVEELGYVGAGRKYGISDNGFRKWIRTYESEMVAK